MAEVLTDLLRPMGTLPGFLLKGPPWPRKGLGGHWGRPGRLEVLGERVMGLVGETGLLGETELLGVGEVGLLGALSP